VTLGSRRFLPPEAISRIHRLEVTARNVVEGFLSGMHRSPYFGQSIEFAQHREYVPGDDVRRIDWKVWSKTDRYYLKQYEEETNLRTTVLVDCSESMLFGSGEFNKFEYGCSIAAALTYLLLRQQDAVGLVAFDDRIRVRVPSSSKQNHLNQLLAGLASITPSQKSAVDQLLSQLADEQSRRGLIVLISDLFVPRASLFKGLRLLRSRGHDVMVFHVLDDAELDFNYAGTTRFEGMEEQGELVCDPRALRDGYLAAMNTFLAEIRRYCTQQMIDYQVTRPSENLDAVLSHYLNHRVGMRQSVRQ
jgi:uncharacterized protein (DUF58 family)